MKPALSRLVETASKPLFMEPDGRPRSDSSNNIDEGSLPDGYSY